MPPEEQGIENAESSRTDDIAAAFDKHEVETPAVVETAAPVADGAAPAPESAAPAPDTAAAEARTDGRDATGRFAPRSGDKPALNAPPADQAAAAPVVEDRLAKPPASWKKEEADHWAKAPPQIREAVMRREVETNRALQESAEARRGLQTLQDTISPYMNNLRAANSDPVTAIKTFFGYDNTLRHGTNLEKAQAITKLIKSYNVDIEALDATLAGVQPRPEDMQQNAIQQALQRELAPIREMMNAQQQREQMAQQQVVETTRASLGTFASQNPHFDAVRMDMADLMDMATARGQELTLKEAYDRACWQNPEIRSILLAEQQRAAGGVQHQAAQRARNAAVSVRNTPVVAAGAAAGGAGRSRADDIAAAFDAHTGQE